MGSVCLAWPRESDAAMHALIARTGAADIAALMQDALRVYEWVLDHQAAGQVIVAETTEGRRRTVLAPMARHETAWREERER